MRDLYERCFLFRTGAEGGAGRRVAFWLWNGAMVVLSSAGITVLTLLLAYGNYGSGLFFDYFRNPVIFLLNWLPVLLAEALLWLLTGRAWAAFLVSGAVFFIAAAGNYFKLMFRDDPFIFSDFTVLNTAFDVAGGYDIAIGKRMGLCIACIVLGTVFLFFLVRGRMRPRARVAGALVVLLCLWPTARLMRDDRVFASLNSDGNIGRWTPTQNFIIRGFVYPFLHSVNDAFDTKPDGYDGAAAQALLDGYTDADIPEDRKVNIISIQLEAFSDLGKLGVTGIDGGVYELYHRILDESCHGTLVTNSFGGGTENTERCFMTGLSELRDFRTNTNSYLWYLKSQGYHTTGSHPCVQGNYNRVNINRWLGADDYYFLENHYGELAGGGVAFDDILIPEILRLYREDVKGGRPVYSFNVTFQGHGPYVSDYLYNGDGYWDMPGRTDYAWYILNNYFSQVQNTCQNLWDLIEGLRNEEEPVVLVLYGDHKPWLGNSNSVYQELGINLNTNTQDGFYNYYSTEYVIWGNDAAKAVTGCDFTGEDETISATFLMNKVFHLLGWEGSAYMQYADTVMAALPVVNSHGYCLLDGEIVPNDALPEDEAEILGRFLDVQYYYRNHFLYRDAAG